MTIVALLLACSVWMAGVLKRNENVRHYIILIFGRDGKEMRCHTFIIPMFERDKNMNVISDDIFNKESHS